MYPAQEKPVDPTQAPALIVDMTLEEYHKEKTALSKSSLAEMECPRRYQWLYMEGGVDQEEDFLNVGNAVHTLALEPKLFEARFHILPEGHRRDARTQAHKDEVAKAAGRSMITAKDHYNIQGMAKSIVADKKALALLERKGLIEASIFWTDPETGIRFKARPDLLGDDNLVVDIKTAASAHPNDFQRAAFDLKYDMSVALTSRGVKALRGAMPDNYVFLVVEKEEPWPVMCFDCFRPWPGQDMAPLSYYDVGSHRLDQYIGRYLKCREENRWPSYLEDITPMSVPGYALKQLENGGA